MFEKSGSCAVKLEVTTDMEESQAQTIIATIPAKKWSQGSR